MSPTSALTIGFSSSSPNWLSMPSILGNRAITMKPTEASISPQPRAPSRESRSVRLKMMPHGMPAVMMSPFATGAFYRS